MSARKTNRNFPPFAIADLSKASASNFIALLRETKNREIALVLGAGISNSAGIPTWSQLLQKICSAFFYHWEFECQNSHTTIDKPPANLSIAFANEYMWSERSINNASAFACGDPLLVAQQIKNCIRDIDWKWLLRRALYDSEDGSIHTGSPSGLIRRLAELCAKKPSIIGSIISYNYDDLLELCFRANGIRHKAIFSSPIRNTPDLLPIFHPHGYLPLNGGPANTSFVLAESDYIINAAAPYSWSNLIQLHTFSKASCVFIGASMRDTALRRLLRLSRTTHELKHFAFLPSSTPTSARSTMFDALFDKDLRELGVHTIRYMPLDSVENTHDRLLSLLVLWNKCSDKPSKIWEIEGA